MLPPGADTLLVRHSEIGTKSPQVQRHMEHRLGDNIAATLDRRDFSSRVERQRGRIFVHTTPEEIEAVRTIAAQTFGVQSASPTVRTQPTIEAIRHTLAEVASATYSGGSFAVRARRAGPSEAHPFSSTDIEREGGDAIWKAISDQYEPAVDLESPDYRISVECRESEAYVFLGREDGPGGFPIGTQAPVVSMISGGTDSPVAAWEIMRRGCPIYPLYFDFGAYGGADHVARAMAAIARLASYTPSGQLEARIAPIGPIVDRIVSEVEQTRMLTLRRAMFSIAERVADRTDATAIVTGESIGQKSSQTAANLSVTSADIRYPIHRPLLNRDKQAIINHAKELGTYEDASIAAGCNRIAPQFPATDTTREAVVHAEPAELRDLIENACREIETTKIDAPNAKEPEHDLDRNTRFEDVAVTTPEGQ